MTAKNSDNKMPTKRHALIALVTIVLVLSASLTYFTLDKGDDGGGGNEETPARIHGTSHTVPKDDPFFSVGCDFIVIKADDRDPELLVLFNNTRIYIDTNNDQVWDYDYLGNASDELTIADVDSGARIHTDKPVWYRQCLNYWDVYNPGYYNYVASTYITVPPINNLQSSYYVYSGTWYVVVPENTVVHVDSGNNGTVDQNITAGPLIRYSLTVSSFAKVYSNKTFYLYRDNTIVAPAGTDFYLCTEDIAKVIITSDNTTVEIDNNNDGTYDERYNWDKGVNETTITIKVGAHVNSDKSINIIQRNYQTSQVSYYNQLISDGDSLSYLQPSTMMASDYFSLKGYYTSGNNYQHGYIIGSFSNTSYHQDKLTENDLIGNDNDAIGANQIEQITDLPKHVHIWGSKPFSGYSMAFKYESYNYHYTFYPNIPASYIFSTMDRHPNELGLNTSTTMDVRVFNPTADTNITNISVKIKFPDNFTLSNGTSLNVTVKKIFLRNDTLITSDTKSITPTQSGGNYTFTLNSTTFTDIFDYMDVYRYYKITYKIKTPSTAGNYDFAPVEVGYDASTWKLPGNN